MTSAGPTQVESLRAALHRLMESHQDVVVIGEDIRDPYGGAFKVTKGLSSRFPDRVFATPISEAGLVGAAVGMAMRGLRPVAEIMFGDFVTLAADQLINTAAKFPLMYRHRVAVPLVVRTPMGGGRGYGPTHSQSLEKHFLGVPGLTVVAPSATHDAGALLEQAVLGTDGPLLFVEYKNLYGTRRVDGAGALRIRPGPEHAGWPTVVAENFEDGVPDVVALAYGGVSAHLLQAMERLVGEEIKVRTILASLISSAPSGALLQELRGQAPILVCEESTAGFNWGAEVIASLFEHGALPTGRRVQRISSNADIVPAAARLESEMLVTERRLYTAILEVL
jgi:pyruvate/2-oxoglutarate/acetoin dehydrogenase E1 component